MLLTSLAYSLLQGLAVTRGGEVSENTEMLWMLVFGILVTAWAKTDARAIRPQSEYSYLLMFFFWPLVLPYHLVRSRGLEGLVLFVGFLTICLAPNLVQIITAVYVEHAP